MFSRSKITFLAVLAVVALGGGWLVGRLTSAGQITVINPIPTPAPAPKEPIRLIFVGDIMLSRSVGTRMAELNDFKYPFLKVADPLSGADLAFGNLETTLSNRGRKIGSIYSFRADPRAVEGLAYAGFDVLSVANNHIWDYGREAFEDTLAVLSQNGISPVGGGINEAQARAPVVKNIRGTQIAFMAYTDLLPAGAGAGADKPGANIFDETRFRQDLARAASASDMVIVSFHTGEEYKLTHNAHQEKVYRAAIEAGADLVVGHHPHVVQEVEQYRSGWIAYSLGNFVFDQNFSTQTRQGLALEVTLNLGAEPVVKEVRQLPVSISLDYQPSFIF